jgi:hypothetical protein
MSRPERGKGERHARENGWLALSTLALQYQRHISRVLRLRAQMLGVIAFKRLGRQRQNDISRSLMQRLVSRRKVKPAQHGEPGATVKARG